MNRTVVLTTTLISCLATGLPTTTGDHRYPGTFVQRAPSLADPAKQVDRMRELRVLLAHKKQCYLSNCAAVNSSDHSKKECRLLEMELGALTQLYYSQPKGIAQELKKVRGE